MENAAKLLDDDRMPTRAFVQLTGSSYRMQASLFENVLAQNPVFERLARAGYVVSGLLHLAIGYLAIRIALGSGGGSADQSGALAAVAAKPGGIAALWVAAVAFLVMALWRLVERPWVVRPTQNPKAQRRKCWIGGRPSRWRWSISRSHTPRSDSPGAPGNPPVHRIPGSAHA